MFEVCQHASLGAASGGRLPASSFTASSVFLESVAAKYGRLQHASYGWCSSSASIVPNNYLQVDLGAVYTICAVATQGNARNNVWTTKYRLSTSINGVSWNAYLENGRDKVRNSKR